METRSRLYYQTRTAVRILFWGTVTLAAIISTITVLEWFTWSVWYDQPKP